MRTTEPRNQDSTRASNEYEPRADYVLRPHGQQHIADVDVPGYWNEIVRGCTQPLFAFENTVQDGGFILPIGDSILRVTGAARVEIITADFEHVHNRRTVRLNPTWRLISCRTCAREVAG